MPRYFFHSLDGHADLDAEGTDLPNVDAARVQAVVYASKLLKGNPNQIWDGRALRVEVTSATADVLFVIVTKLERP